MNFVAVFTLWTLCLFARSAHSDEDWSRSRPWSSHGVDKYNATQLQEYAASLQRVLVQQPGSSSPGMTPNVLAGRIRNPFEGIWLESRQSCTGGADNFCFPDPTDYCGNCGTCCTHPNEGYCCGSTSVCCGPDRTIKGTELGGCCGSWQTCEQDTGCTDPTTTVTETVTSWSYVTSTITAYTTYYTSSTVFTTKYTTLFQTASNVDTATDVEYTTITPAPKARRTVYDYYALATKTQGIDIERDDLPVSATTVDAQAPIVTVYAHPQFDVVAHNLGKLGVVVKRQNTITSTITITTSAVTTEFSTVYSDITSVDSVVSTILSTITSIIFIDAATTVQATSTITAGSNPATDTTTSADVGAGTANSDTQQQSSTNNGGDGGGGLSTAEKAGIGVGAGAGAILIIAIIAALWRRSKKNRQEQPAAYPTAYAAVGAFSTDKEQYGDRPPHEQRESYMSNTSSVMGGAGAAPYYYRSVSPQDPDAPGRTTHEMADNTRMGFQYQPYELYEEGHHPHELDARNGRGRGIH